MDVTWYRNKVANVPKYRSPKWQDKVQRMPDNQVIALYYKFKKDGLFDKRRKEDDRIYVFGEQKITVPNGGYLTPERIQHYEFCFGKLYSVTYRGQTIINI